MEKGTHMRSKRNRNRYRPALVGLVLVILVAALLAGCGDSSSGGAPSASASPSGDQPILKIGVTPAGFDTLNPFVLYYAFDAFGYYQMYPYLTQFLGQSTEAQPDLAESWTVSEDGLTWTFKLRSGAVWSDGKPITANDAAFTMNTVVRLQGGAAAILSTAVPGIKSAEATDDTTLVISCERPIASMLTQMTFLPILPEHVWGPLAEGDGAKLKTITNDPAKETVVVAGPFAPEKVDLKGTTIFKRVETYYGPKPLITGFGVQAFSNADAMAQALKSGSLDVGAYLPPTAGEALADDPTLEVQGIGYVPQQLAVNYSGNSAHRELSEPDVRQAISLALDRQAVIDDVYRGYGEAGGSVLVPPYVPQFMSDDVPTLGRDVAKANLLLDDLGYAKGSDGIRVADGVRMSYTLLIVNYMIATEAREVELFKAHLAEVGIEVKQKTADSAQYFADIFGPKGDYGTFDMAIWDWAAGPDPDLGLMTFSSAMLGVYNPTGYSSPKYDDLYAQQSAEVDASKRKAIIDQMSALLQQDVAEIPIAYAQNVTSWNAKWQNVPDAGFFGGWPNYAGKDIFTTLWLQQ